jgi:hypothetical protein
MGRVGEGIVIHLLGPEARDAEVARLADPWIGDEGPLDAEFRRGLAEGDALRLRGVAFDNTTTVLWDESGTQVLQAAPDEASDGEIVALRSKVLIHQRFLAQGLRSLVRIDYLKRGALLGSRFTTGEEHARS